ncbi:hypothetical protein CAC42_1737 [Sphaceloma murrayae]|uniref:Uncharacterized protein n=1 Tax=Sphaceloma murrayae TaxID=2082308 RepID=A0A2K1QHS9_9PEZI|nr:hypothetical protein CAC42_1737 [Sphaceloma murrayae]
MKVTLSSALCVALSASMINAQFTPLRRDDGFQRTQLELQGELENNKHDPATAQQVQNAQLEVAKMKQDQINSGQAPSRRMARRSAFPATPEEQLAQMKADQDASTRAEAKRIAEVQKQQLADQADAIAKTPGAGVGAGITHATYTDGVVYGWDGKPVS